MNIIVDLNTPISNGTEVVFRSPVDCSQVTGLLVNYQNNGETASKEFAFADAHGNNVGDIDHLFAENVVVKVILDVTTGMAFVQNADTNAYLEGRFAELEGKKRTIPVEGQEFEQMCDTEDLVPGNAYLIIRESQQYNKGDILLATANNDYVIISNTGQDYVLTEADKEEIAEQAVESLFGMHKSSNLIDWSTKKVGMLHTNNQVLTGGSYDSYRYFEQYIEVNAGDTLTFQCTAGSTRLWYGTIPSSWGKHVKFNRLCAYDENKTLITEHSIQSPAYPYVVPDGVTYIRITVLASTFEQEKDGITDWALVANATEPIPYEPYGEVPTGKIDEKYLPETDADVPVAVINAFLPTEICCAVGRTIEVYNAQVCPQSERYHFRWDCQIGKAMKRKFSITGEAANVGEYSLSLSIIDDSMNVVWSGSTTLKIVSQLTTGKSIVCIGDSLTNNKKWLPELVGLSDNKITLMGTRGVNMYDSQNVMRNCKHEGRSGFSAGSYLTAREYTYESEGIHPFWDGSRFNWNYYVTNSLNGNSPDAVQIFLGTNGMALDPAENAGNIKQMVDYIRQDNATIPIFLVWTLYRGNQNGLGVQTGSDGYTASNRGKYKYEEDMKVFNLMTKLADLLGGYANLYFVPVSLCHDSEYNFGAVETPVNPRATQKEYLPTEATHPQEQGYLQMADIMYSVLSAH